MFHDLKLNLVQDEQSHDMYEKEFHFYQSIQDMITTDNQVLNSKNPINRMRIYPNTYSTLSLVVHPVESHLSKVPKKSSFTFDKFFYPYHSTIW